MITRSDRFERAMLTAILLVVGIAAGAASFTHVHNWTIENSPTGTADWFGWANAAISEMVPIASLLTMRQRRRAGKAVTYPMFLLVSAVALSLSAQLAVAKPGISGWLLSAVPSMAFLGLSKLVLTTKVDAKPAVLVDAALVAELTPEIPAVDAAPVASVTPEAATRRVAKRVTPRVLTSAQKVWRAAAKLEGASPAQIAAKAGVSESTVRRHLASPSAPVPATRTLAGVAS